MSFRLSHQSQGQDPPSIGQASSQNSQQMLPPRLPPLRPSMLPPLVPPQAQMQSFMYNVQPQQSRQLPSYASRIRNLQNRGSRDPRILRQQR